MKLGTQTGSLTNHIYSRAVNGQPIPEVGMGATILCWTDRHAGTITKVEPIKTGFRVTVQEDKTTRTDKNGMSECQEYDYTRDENGSTTTFAQREDGGWQCVWFNEKTKRWNKREGNGLRIGERREYHDFSF